VKTSRSLWLRTFRAKKIAPDLGKCSNFGLRIALQRLPIRVEERDDLRRLRRGDFCSTTKRLPRRLLQLWHTPRQLDRTSTKSGRIDRGMM
jgi:hypothetical protein